MASISRLLYLIFAAAAVVGQCVIIRALFKLFPIVTAAQWGTHVYVYTLVGKVLKSATLGPSNKDSFVCVWSLLIALLASFGGLFTTMSVSSETMHNGENFLNYLAPK